MKCAMRRHSGAKATVRSDLKPLPDEDGGGEGGDDEQGGGPAAGLANGFAKCIFHGHNLGVRLRRRRQPA